MANKVELVKVETDDWVALYKNGLNTWEGHSLNISEVLNDLVGSEITSYKAYYIDFDLLEDVYYGSFPLKLEDVDEEHLS